MNTYPQELVTPPLALVALLGCPQLHPSVGEYLRSQHRPPMNSLGVAEPWAAGRLFGERKGMLTAPKERAGILKAGWFAKHRKRRPAVAVLFLERKAVAGDPKLWPTSCSAMEAVKNAARARSAKMLVVVVGPGGELPEERLGAISRIAGVQDKRYILMYNPEEEGGLRVLGKLLHEAAGQFYLDSARRQLNIHAERRGMTPERSARVHFKAGALAEFRTDWATAVKTYQNAYAELTRVALGSDHPVQRAFEVAAVAEQIHIKVVTLLLHQLRLAEAVAQFTAHMKLFRQLPFQIPPAFAAAHWGWVARQYTVMGELMTARADSAALQGEASPVHLFFWAAEAAVERRKCAQKAASLRGGRSPRPALLFAAGEYVGQWMAKDPTRHLTDEEFLQFLEVREAGTKQGAMAVEALDLAQEVCAKMGGRASRQAYHTGRLLAREHMCLGDYETAFRLLLPIAGMYRREGWQLPLTGVAQELRECAQQLGHTQEQLIYTFELASLETGMSTSKRQKLAETAIHMMTHAPDSGDEGSEPQPIRLQISKFNHPLQTCVAVQAGFQPLPDSDVLPKHVSFGLQIQNCLPVDLPLHRLTATVRRGQGAVTSSEQVDLAPALESEKLVSKASLRWGAKLSASPGDLFQLTEISLHISASASITWSLDGLPGSSSGDASGGRSPGASAHVGFTAGLYEVAIPVSLEAPRLEISRDSFALMGEQFLAQLEVLAAGGLQKPRIKVFGGYMEGQQRLDINMSPLEGAKWIQAEESQSEEENSRETYLGVIELDDIPKNSVKVVEVEAQLSRAGQLRLAAQLEFHGQDQDSAEGLQASTDVEVLKPFTMTSEFCTAPQTTAMTLPELEDATQRPALPTDSTAFLAVQLRNQAPTQVQIMDVNVFPAEGLDVRLLGDQFGYGAGSHQLRKADSFASVFGLSTHQEASYDSAGLVLVKWKRARGDESSSNPVETRLSLPGLEVVPAELEVRVDVSGRAVQGIQFPMALHISNHSSLLQQIRLAINDGSGFSMAGNRHDVINLLPHSTHAHKMTLIAHQPGTLLLPQCKIMALRNSAVLEPLSGQQIIVSPVYANSCAEHSKDALSQNIEGLSIS